MTIPLAHLNLAMERTFPTPLSNSTLLPLLLLSLATEKHTPRASYRIRKNYDYIIVGGGTAGSVVAARLSEIPCTNVLVLETGPLPPRMSDVPAMDAYLRASDVSWNTLSTPQKHTGLGLVDRKVVLLGGKAVGGSTIINSGIYVRGNKKDYDDWSDGGADGWSYKEVLPYFKKAENNLDYEYYKNGYHGVNGPVTVKKPAYAPEIKSSIVRTAKEMGFQFVDPNGPTQIGFYDFQANLRRNRRCSAAKAYLVPVEKRRNLDILPNALVRKVIIRNKRATGVLFDFDGLTYKVGARREVIVSAGAVHTPQVLMLSGVGPKNDLERVNISVIADLPVGRNLQDHAGFSTFFVLNSSIQTFSKKLSDSRNIKQYIYYRRGPLASPGGISVIAFLRNNQSYPEDDFPNSQIVFVPGSVTGLQKGLNIKPEVYEEVFGRYINESLMICHANHLHPKSLGTITVRSNNPYDMPIIDPNYLEHPQDVKDIVAGIKVCKRIGTSSYMSDVVSHIFETTIPGCEKYVGDEDRYLECAVRSIIISGTHYVGTAKMGDPADPTTVVDPKLRVKGIHGLRVVDASIMPTIPSGNTATPTFMIGEKASDLIKESITCF